MPDFRRGPFRPLPFAETARWPRRNRPSSVARLFLHIAALMFLAGASVPLPSARAETLMIAAAADLKFPMDEIVAAFRKTHPGDQIDVTYGSSGKFHTQIQHGAPFDLFFSADIDFARSLRAAGLAASEPALYAIGRIVLWSPTRDAVKMSPHDLDDPAIRKIAIANPGHAPYGKRAEEALRAVGLWEKLQDKLVYGENIAQTTQFVQSGAADIGVISLSLALNEELARKGGYALIPDSLHAPLEQAYVITAHGRENALAKEFARQMTTREARRVMVRYGFVLPSETANR